MHRLDSDLTANEPRYLSLAYVPKGTWCSFEPSLDARRCPVQTVQLLLRRSATTRNVGVDDEATFDDSGRSQPSSIKTCR